MQRLNILLCNGFRGGNRNRDCARVYGRRRRRGSRGRGRSEGASAPRSITILTCTVTGIG